LKKEVDQGKKWSVHKLFNSILGNTLLNNFLSNYVLDILKVHMFLFQLKKTEIFYYVHTTNYFKVINQKMSVFDLTDPKTKLIS
jgi:hypothetical protein